MQESDIIKAYLAYPNLDFTVNTYIEDFNPHADAEDVIQTIENSSVLEHWDEQAVHMQDWSGAMELLSEQMTSVEGVIGDGNDFDRVFERAQFNIDESDSRDGITVECKEGRRRWDLTFDADNINIRHEKIFENEDEEIENRFNSGSDTGWSTEVSSEGDSFKNTLLNAHFERLDDACYFVGGNDVRREDLYHKLWLEPSSESTTLRYTIYFDEYDS